MANFANPVGVPRCDGVGLSGATSSGEAIGGICGVYGQACTEERGPPMALSQSARPSCLTHPCRGGVALRYGCSGVSDVFALPGHATAAPTYDEVRNQWPGGFPRSVH